MKHRQIEFLLRELKVKGLLPTNLAIGTLVSESECGFVGNDMAEFYIQLSFRGGWKITRWRRKR